MAEHREPSEAERLLAEADSMLSGGTEPRRSVQPSGSGNRPTGPGVTRLKAAVVAGVVAGAGIWVLFALLPFLRANSGAAGAFLAAFVAVLLFRRQR